MSWDSITSAWETVATALDTAWTSAYDAAVSTYEGYVKAEPKKTADQVTLFVGELEETRRLLDKMAQQLPKPPSTPEDHALHKKHAAFEARYHEIAAGFYKDVAAQGATQVGVIPVVVVAGIAVGMGAATWSFAGYEYAVNLREQTALASKELDARIAASKEGRTLQESTIPAPPSSPDMNTLLMGGAALIGGALLILNLKRG